jgi:hypothetical protein
MPIQEAEKKSVVRLPAVIDPDCFNPAFCGGLEPAIRADSEELGTPTPEILAGFSRRADSQKFLDDMGYWD